MSTGSAPERAAWTVIVNAAAGSSEDAVVDAVTDALRESVEVDLARTEDLDDLADVLREVPTDATVVVLGGDGSLHAVVSTLDELGRLREVVVGLVPLGTGNDFARTLEIDPEDPVAAARALVGAPERDVDLIRAGDDEVVVNAAHVGVGAEATRAADPWKKRLGPLGYAVGAIVSGFRTEGFRGHVEVDGEPVAVRSRLLQVAVGNGRFVGGGAPLLPNADPFDGQLDVVVSWADSPLRRLAYAWRLRSGRHTEGDDATPLRGRSVTVTGAPVRGNSDGEVSGPSPTHAWTVEPGAWRLLVPGA